MSKDLNTAKRRLYAYFLLCVPWFLRASRNWLITRPYRVTLCSFALWLSACICPFVLFTKHKKIFARFRKNKSAGNMFRVCQSLRNFTGFYSRRWCISVQNYKQWERFDVRAPFYNDGLTLIPAWRSNHIPSRVWDEITYPFPNFKGCHYHDVTMESIASQITSLTIVYSAVYSAADQRKHQSSASLAFVRGIHRGPMNSPHKGPVTRKMFPFDDVIMHRWSLGTHNTVTS